MFLAILPAFALVFLAANFWRSLQWDWRRSVLRATILIGVYAVVTLEILSLFASVRRVALVAVWGLPVILQVYLFLRKQKHPRILPSLKQSLPTSWFERSLLVGIFIVVLVTGITAWYAPPNTYDSLTYHMPRVVHWAQEGSLRPFATGILRQLYMSPGAEMGILHVFVLGQSDRFANFIQWGAMVVSLIGASLVASNLGASRRGQIFAALFAATLPMGIAQASSTMTDYVATLWVVLVVAESLRMIQGERDWLTILSAGGAVGLAFLTKPIAMPFLLPFGLWVLCNLLKKEPFHQVVKLGIVVVLIVLCLNLGQFIRNWLVFGSIIGGGSNVSNFINAKMTPALFLSNLLRNMSLHVGTPWEQVNAVSYDLLAKVHWKLNVALTDPRTSIHPFFQIWSYPSDETRTPNTLQAVFLVIAAFLALFKRKRFPRTLFVYGISAISGFALLAATFKFTVLGSRYHMPFFVLAAPLVGMILERTLLTVLIAVSSFVLMIGAVPVLLNLEQRPLSNEGSIQSVLSARRIDQYYVTAPQIDEPYYEVSELIESVSCDRVGLILRGDTPEYVLWVFLDAPTSGIEIDWIISQSDPSGQYRKLGFNPCAVICEGCSSRDDYNGLPLEYDRYGYRLFLGIEG